MTFSRTLLLAVCCLPFTLFAQKTQRLNLKIIGYNGGVAKLLGTYAEQNYLADTALISSDGTAVFQKKEGYPEGHYYVVLPDGNFQLILANGENPTLETAKGQLVSAMYVSNSLENKLLYENLNYQTQLEQDFNRLSAQLKSLAPNSSEAAAVKKNQQDLLDKRDALLLDIRQKYPNAFFPKFKLAGQNPKYRFVFRPDGSLDSNATLANYRTDWWKDVDFSDARLARTPVYFNKLKKFIEELTPQHQDSLIKSCDFIVDKSLSNSELFKITINWLAYKHKPGVTSLMDGEAVYAHLILKYFTKDHIQDLSPEELQSIRDKALNMQASLLGKKGQDVRARDKNGVYKSLYELKTPYKIVYIYNPECEHCREETPKLRAFYDQWKNKGVGIFSIVSNPKNKEEWQEFAKACGINWTDVYDPQLESRFFEKYYIDITPECYLLDENNTIIGKNLKAHQIGELIEYQQRQRK